MKQLLNVDQWHRKSHFHFFKNFEEPFFGVTVQVDCTHAYQQAKENGYSFFLWYLFQALKAANAIEAFRYRIADDTVWVYDQVNASPTINRPDGSFGFAYMDYFPEWAKFEKAAQQEIERVQANTDLVPASSAENVLHISSLPWLNFTGIAHARCFSFKDSIPKISFGKMTENNGVRTMPVSIHVHHALMDGFQVAQFVDLFQANLNG